VTIPIDLLIVDPPQRLHVIPTVLLLPCDEAQAPLDLQMFTSGPGFLWILRLL